MKAREFLKEKVDENHIFLTETQRFQDFGDLFLNLT